MNARDVDDLFYSSKHPAPEDLEETKDLLKSIAISLHGISKNLYMINRYGVINYPRPDGD